MKMRTQNVLFMFVLWLSLTSILTGVIGLWSQNPVLALIANVDGDSSEEIIESEVKKIRHVKPNRAEIRIASVDIVSPVIFPDAADIKTLKAALDKGVAHYPYSPYPGENGNVFLFGHSSNKPVEKNPARTVFTELNKIEPGEKIEIETVSWLIEYRVTSVKILKPDQTEIYLAGDKPKLTLSTCWPVGDARNRFIVEAEFVGSYPVRTTPTASDTSS